MARGEPLEGCCSCHIAPPCSYCTEGTLVVIKDDLFLNLDCNGWTEDFEKAAFLFEQDLADSLAKSHDAKVEKYQL